MFQGMPRGIAFGILLDGTGTAWINGAKFEVVDSSVPVTDMHLNMTTPSNLSFENLALLILQ